MHLLRIKKQAFTIAEVALACFVLSAGIVTVVSLIAVAHRNSLDTRDLLIASELAQEGVEIARNIRDNNNAYRVDNWSSGDNCQSSTTGNCDPFRYFPTGANQRCTASYGDTTFSCAGGVSTMLGLNNQGLYQHGFFGKYYRLLKIDHTGGSESARVQSFVTWQDPGNNLNGNGAVSWCTGENKCVFTELYLSYWR